ncbi:leucine-rich repeat and fibronectin type-III domain-containing protein 3 [Striga asiatica]|uniref:Leucine-rich repeat and fibronectin type-III domain-containing protein 3 n=1 Tax=Striga asiatica TaxID=4170 RepID=A0A5A7PFX0_STRAF|nr:leucine-rich repeat and fibronectin type-III domain-containing protein 3 [Striga asiatica]
MSRDRKAGCNLAKSRGNSKTGISNQKGQNNKRKQKVDNFKLHELCSTFITILVLLSPAKLTFSASTNLDFLNNFTISFTSFGPHSSTVTTHTPPPLTVLSICPTNRPGKRARSRYSPSPRSKIPSKKGRLWGSARLTSGGESTSSTPVTSSTPISCRACTAWPGPAETTRARESFERWFRAWSAIRREA